MSAQKPFLDAIKERRTIYALNKQSPISDKKIVELAEQALLHVPSSFNSQSTRLVVLLNADHDQFWDYVLEVLKPLTPEDKFPSTQERVGGFKAGYGTVSIHIPHTMRALLHNVYAGLCCPAVQAPSFIFNHRPRGIMAKASRNKRSGANNVITDSLLRGSRASRSTPQSIP
jgi:hypothetical protein